MQSSEVNVQKIQEVPPKQHHQSLESPKEEEKQQTLTKQGAQGMSPAVITTLLLVPLVAVIAVAVFIRWRKSHMYRGSSSCSAWCSALLYCGIDLIDFFLFVKMIVM